MSEVITSILSESTVTAIVNGLRALRSAHVEPMGLSLRVGVEGRLAWHWYKFKALPGHPAPGNAIRGYSHPVYRVGEPVERQAIHQSASPFRGPVILSAEAVEGLDDGELWESIILPLIEAAGFDPRHCYATYGRYEGASILRQCRNAPDRSSGELATIDLTRGGVDPWAEYPDAGLEPIVESAEGFDRPVLHWGGEREKSRVRRVRRLEREMTDAYMAAIA